MDLEKILPTNGPSIDEVKKYIRTLENVLQSYDLSDKDFLELSRLCGCLDAALEPLVLDEGDE